MVKLTEHGVVLAADGTFAAAEDALQKAEGKEKTMAYGILKTHNHSNNMEQLQLKFDALVSPDNNYVNILQTARASGIKKFPTCFPTATTPSARLAAPSMRMTTSLALEMRKSTAVFSFRHTGQFFTSICVR